MLVFTKLIDEEDEEELMISNDNPELSYEQVREVIAENAQEVVISMHQSNDMEEKNKEIYVSL